MDVLLINPPARKPAPEPIVVPPLGLAYLAASAREAGHQVSIIDGFGDGLSWQSFEGAVSRRSYDLIGLTGMTPVFDTVKRAITICRPYAKTLILGGPHATAFRHTVINDNPELDYVVYGEGEETFVELLSALENGRQAEGMPGVISPNKAGPPRALVFDLDGLPLPARDLLPNDKYRYPLCGPKRMTTMITSRGCPYPCIFCDKGVFGSKWRARSAENILKELDQVVIEYGAQTVVLYDDLFTLDKDRVQQFCQSLLSRGYRISWKAEARVDRVDPEMLKLMKRAGCDTIAYGVETANQVGLDYLRKKTTPEEIRRAFKLTQQAGIKTMGYFILGIPVETFEQGLKTIRFAIDLKVDYAQFSALSPLPGTSLYLEAQEKNWYREIPAFNVHDKDLLRPVIMSPKWDEDKLVSILQLAHRKFYLRPSYILKSLLRARKWEDLAVLFGLGRGMVQYVLRRRGRCVPVTESGKV